MIGQNSGISIFQPVNKNRTFRFVSNVILILVFCAAFEVCVGYNQRTGPLAGEAHLGRHQKFGIGTNKNYYEYYSDTKRSSRHRRVPLADPVAEVIGSSSANSGSNYRIAQDQVENRHKPKFEKCHFYEPKVEEESSRGTKVIQVFAKDDDGDSVPSGKVTYSIVSTHNKFNIDKETGWLTTNAIFNRDEPAREKKVHVTVKAQDHGRPQLEDVCTLAVTVTDKNDNSPVFDKASYNLPIPQDTTLGSTIMRVSATDVDEGDNQRITYDLMATRFPNDIEYFQWDSQTGVVSLRRKLDKPIGHTFELKATASDGGRPPRSTPININLEVKESNNKPPSFETGPHNGIIELEESYTEFSKPVATYTANSNIPDDRNVFFLLLNGRTEKTNKDGTFRHVQSPDNLNEVQIYLAKTMVYEAVKEYTLTLQVRNAPDLVAEAQLIIKVKDNNNLAPIFTNVESGSVLEHEPPGTFVMQVSAVDNDGTYPNNRVQYFISPNNPRYVLDGFEIHPDTGVLQTKREFDREQRAVYAVTINAKDGAPSSLLQNGKENITPNNFRIAIADKNDNPPYFPQQRYYAEVPEDQDVGSKVIEVRAEDLDTEASVTKYDIDEGNVGQAFTIEKETGFIRVAKPLDYESIKRYNLRVSAWDGQFGNKTFVEINIKNVNDMKPQFNKRQYEAEHIEERADAYPLLQVKAFDPDIEDRAGPQNITFYLDSSSFAASHFSIDKYSGSLRIVKPLDRDPPNGFPSWSIYIYAKDENGGPKGLENFVNLKVDLVDVNDNAPFLDMPDGLVWPENEDAGVVGVLIADDYDTKENGAPYTFRIAPNAGRDIKSWFGVEQIQNGSYVLTAKRKFDREQRKEYKVPVEICDHKNLCDVSQLKLIIGDKNDNPMKTGSSEIFVYNYEGRAPQTDIGRVYVDDPDDWDLPDKTFDFQDPLKWSNKFGLDRQTGVIKMRRVNFPPGTDILKYSIDFLVEDPVHGQVNQNAVPATVDITIKRIPREAVIKSGSMRIVGSPEDFIRQDGDGYSKRDRFGLEMKRRMNLTYFDVFTVLPVVSRDNRFTDVRFAAHGSPYYAPERMEGEIAETKMDLEKKLGISINMIHIDECLYELKGQCAGKSCVNDLRIDEQPVSVLTNTSSFVGVQARVFPLCPACVAPKPEISSCNNPNPCLNNGTCELIPVTPGGRGYRCQCPANNNEIFGPNCERLAASFNSQGWSWHKGLPACGNTHLSLIFKTQSPTGTLLYNGPMPNTNAQNVTDFMLLEIVESRLKMYINFGSGVRTLELKQPVDDNEDHYLVMRWTNETVQMELESCPNQIARQNCIVHKNTRDSRHHYLNTNSPLQVGGISFSEQKFKQFAGAALGLNSGLMPHTKGFAGCIKNLTFRTSGKGGYGFGQEKMLYDLGNPAAGSNHRAGCDDAFVQAVKATDLNMTFLIAILSCLAILLLIILILIVYRRKKKVYSDKDIDCDIRENIINYEDEGGGEGDQTGYDLSVLRMMSEGTNGLPHFGNGGLLMAPNDKGRMMPLEAAPDIQTFLQTNKDRIDGDPDATPFDDLRHYAYEGDGNSGGSLSSLNSGTSDGDLEFDYLHNFGPRFKKLADMYGEQPDSSSDEDGAIGDENEMDRIARDHHHHHQYPHQHHQHRAGSHLSDRMDEHTQDQRSHPHSQQYHPQHDQQLPSNYAASPNMVMMSGGNPVPPPSESWC